MQIQLQQIEGYAHGALQSSIIIRFSGIRMPSNDFMKRLKFFRSCLSDSEYDDQFTNTTEIQESEIFTTTFVSTIDAINQYCGDQRFTPIIIFREADALCLTLPTLSPKLSAFNINSFASFLAKSKPYINKNDVLSLATQLKNTVRPLLPSGTNAVSFIAAAAHRRIPFKTFNRNYVIFGYGNSTRIFNSSITDQESAVGVRLAKSKVDTNHLLKMSGFPVTTQFRVNTIDDAVRIAEEIDYPLVLKPLDEEQGRGIYANIIDEVELRDAFAKSKNNYKNLILEKFVVADAYRAHVQYGKVKELWKMTPASITGNGTSSILELIEIENNTPERISVDAPRKPIPLDEVTNLNLQKIGLALSSVPENGKVIQLAATSNVSRGGTSQSCLSILHPKNADLCIQAAHTLGLDICGIDLLSLDASVPWDENNAVICEVNSQPQLGVLKKYPHLYDDVMDRLPTSNPKISLLVSNDFPQNKISLFNKSLTELEIKCTPTYLLKNGCPTQYFDTLSFSADISTNEHDKLKRILVSIKPGIGSTK